MKKGIAIILSGLLCVTNISAATYRAKNMVILDASPVVSCEYIKTEITTVTTEVTTTFTTTEIATTTTPVTTTTDILTEVTTVSSAELTEEQTTVASVETETYISVEPESVYEEPYIEEVVEETPPPVSEETTVITETENTDNIPPGLINPYYCPYSDWEVDLLARLVTSEDGTSPYNEWGRRMVVDVVLNRMDHPAFGCSTISDVIYAPSQFSCASYIYNFEAGDNERIVREEIANRSNYDVHYFWAGTYPPYGTPLFEAGGNYFTTINY